MTPNIEKLLIDIHAAKAFLDRIECQIRDLIAGDIARINEKAPSAPLEALSDAEMINVSSDTQQTQEGANLSVFQKDGSLSQQEMFPEFDAKISPNTPEKSAILQKTAKKPIIFGLRGCPTLTRRQVLAKYREIAGQKELLDLGDVNEIFGYNRSTSGTFVKHAIKRGELGVIPYGRTTKFLALDVRHFIKRYFDRLQQAKNHADES